MFRLRKLLIKFKKTIFNRTQKSKSHQFELEQVLCHQKQQRNEYDYDHHDDVVAYAGANVQPAALGSNQKEKILK